jgi:hypothetical protein
MPRRAIGVGGDLLESAFQGQVVGLLRVYGWTRIYHAPHGGHSAAPGSRRVAGGQLPEGTGFPDLVALKGPRLLVAELKAETGKLGKGQPEWLEAFGVFAAAVAAHVAEQDPGRRANLREGHGGLPVVEVHVWRPSDWDTLHAVIRGGEPHRHDLDPCA